ncbi:MAG: hypothetical protein KJO20_03300 [Eudoraea sp.]|nr:hypothetical protein [Eudoraea sp.]NNK31175.1 hypothetical protein [Flavobacteriaceae bacterium]
MKTYVCILLGFLFVTLNLSCTTDYYYPEEEQMDDINSPADPSDSDSSADDPSTGEGIPADPPETDPYAGLITYQVDVKPILDQLCVVCHNTTLAEDGVDLSSYYLAKVQIDDILESMQEEEDEDDIMPPSGRVDNTILETLMLWKADGLLEGEAPPEDPDSGTSDGTYTYSYDIAAIIDAECILCHGATSPDAGYDISTYQKTVNQIDLFVARIDLQTGQAGVMPPAGRMDEATIQMIKDWVDQGMPE